MRASGAPMHTWMPPPKPMCCAAFSRPTSNVSGRSNTRGSRFAAPNSSAIFAPRGILEFSCRSIRRLRRLVGDVELVHLHHPVRPLEQVAVPIERHAEQPADDGDRVRLRIVVEQLQLALLRERFQQLSGEFARRL